MKQIKLLRKQPKQQGKDTADAIKAVNNVIVTVENTKEIGNQPETFLTQKGGKM